MIAHTNQRLAVWGSLGSVVTFTFDDFPRTALTAGGDILRAAGVHGTYYAAMGMMNSTNHLGEQFRRDDLDSLLRDGHELANHTFDHTSCQKSSVKQFTEDVRKGELAIREVTGDAECGNFAYPYGRVTIRVKGEVGPRVRSSRGIWEGINGPTVDLNLMRANSLYAGIEQSQRVRNLILENERRQGWLIFYTHDVQKSPSPYGCTPEMLQFAVSAAARSGARILTVAEVMSNLAA
ncbi:MAG TPA: polysaccharide deacetylase family protein [Acidobacteriaceae bacterium]|nr:polysaccharide deacetylase family protein [Acidobacteriaceae bacterium]